MINLSNLLLRSLFFFFFPDEKIRSLRLGFRSEMDERFLYIPRPKSRCSSPPFPLPLSLSSLLFLFSLRLPLRETNFFTRSKTRCAETSRIWRRPPTGAEVAIPSKGIRIRFQKARIRIKLLKYRFTNHTIKENFTFRLLKSLFLSPNTHL